MPSLWLAPAAAGLYRIHMNTTAEVETAMYLGMNTKARMTLNARVMRLKSSASSMPPARVMTTSQKV